MVLYVLLYVVKFYFITLDLYYDVFVALTNLSSNACMTDFFMLSYASLPEYIIIVLIKTLQ